MRLSYVQSAALFIVLEGMFYLPAHAQQKDQIALILPGKSIGEITLRMELPEVYKKLGQPTGGEGAAGTAWDWWVAPKQDHSPAYKTTIRAHVYEGFNEKLVEAIRVESPFFRTDKGVNTQSTPEQIWEAFPDLRYSFAAKADNGATEVYADDTRGIAFELQRIDTKKEARSGTKVTWAHCLSISIFEPGSGHALAAN